MIRNYHKITSAVMLILGMTTAAWMALGGHRLRAAGPFIIDNWLEEPHLSVSYIWNLYERRDGWYVDNWSGDQIAAVDTFEFGMRETFKLMNLSNEIDAHHNNDAWIKLYNVATNDPDGSHDYPPHINIISYWGEAGRSYEGAVNGHYYTTESGQIAPAKTWYAWDIAPTCVPGNREPGINVWVPHLDRNCVILWEERVTDAGEIEVRRDANAPIYTLRNKAASDLDILRDGELVRNVRRTFHNAWINYPTPYPDGIAKVIWEIRDYEADLLTTETIIAKPETGEIVSHDRVETPLDGSHVNEAPVVSITLPEPGATFALGADVLITAEASDSDGNVVQVDFFAADQLLATLTSPPWQWTWSGAGLGDSVLTAQVTDNDNAIGHSTPVTITVVGTDTTGALYLPLLYR